MPEERRFFIPEVIQQPALRTLALVDAVARGYRLDIMTDEIAAIIRQYEPAHSLTQISNVASDCGLVAVQHFLPVDLLLTLGESILPVAVHLPDADAARVAVIWRRVGAYFQVLDPTTGRRWLHWRMIAPNLVPETRRLSVAVWLNMARGEAFRAAIEAQLTSLGLSPAQVKIALALGYESDDWHRIAALDASIRFIQTLPDAGKHNFKRLQALHSAALERDVIPDVFWSVQAATATAHDGDILQARGVAFVQLQPDTLQAHEPEKQMRQKAPELDVEKRLIAGLRELGWLTPGLVITGITFLALSTLFEVVLLQSLWTIGLTFAEPTQRLAYLLLIVVVFVIFLGISIPVRRLSDYWQRRIEIRWRVAYLRHVQQLSPAHFEAYSTADKLYLLNQLTNLGLLPDIVLRVLDNLLQIVFIAIGIALINPASLPFALLAGFLAFVITFISQPLLLPAYQRQNFDRRHLVAYYLNGLVGLRALRTHSGERPLRQQHEAYNATLYRHNLLRLRFEQALEGISGLLVGWGVTVVILLSYVMTQEVNALLVMFYWAFLIPQLVAGAAYATRLYPAVRVGVKQFFALLNLPTEQEAYDLTFTQRVEQTTLRDDRPVIEPARGVTLVLQGVHVAVDDKRVLTDLNLQVAAGEHIAIVGESGAGKSTLISLLLGWHAPTHGMIWVDDAPLNTSRLHQLRQQTAWVEPNIQLWDRSLLENILYGNQQVANAALSHTLVQTDLTRMVESFPSGLQTALGERGRMVSAGQGQRIRLARAFLKADVRLVLMDEALRGLDRESRQTLMHNARQHWQNATLLAVTHDVALTADFDRVLVVRDGRIVEDDTPAHLMAQTTSHYRHLFEADERARRGIWRGGRWRRLWLQDRQLTEQPRD